MTIRISGSLWDACVMPSSVMLVLPDFIAWCLVIRLCLTELIKKCQSRTLLHSATLEFNSILTHDDELELFFQEDAPNEAPPVSENLARKTCAFAHLLITSSGGLFCPSLPVFTRLKCCDSFRFAHGDKTCAILSTSKSVRFSANFLTLAGIQALKLVERPLVAQAHLISIVFKFADQISCGMS